MRIADKSQRGQGMHPKLRKVDEFCSLPLPPATPLVSGIVYEGEVNRIIVEPGVRARRSMLFLASACLAAGVPLGPCEAQQPSQPVILLSGAGDPAQDQHTLKLIGAMLEEHQRENLREFFRIYNFDCEQDEPFALDLEEGQQRLEKMLPDKCVVFVDDLLFFTSRRMLDRHAMTAVRTWARHRSRTGQTFVFVSEGERTSRKLSEIEASHTIYLTHDPEAPTQRGSGFLVHRYRGDDPDTLPRMFSFWDYEYEGTFDCGYFIPGGEDEYCSPAEIRKRERLLEVERLELEGKDGVHIATKLVISRATVCRALKEIHAAKEAAEASKKARLVAIESNSWRDDLELPTSPPLLKG